MNILLRVADERGGGVPHRNLMEGRSAGNLVGAGFKRGRDEARARLYCRGPREPDERLMGANELR